MLEVAILLQLALHEWVEAAVIGALLVFNAVLGLVQEGRARATLEALSSRLALQAVARREGAWRTLPASEIVPGDLIKLGLGGIVPADVRLLEGSVLLDQSMLTGESLPVEAGPGTSTYAGSLVRRGEALAEVTATGAASRFGKAAQLVRIAGGASSQQRTVLRVVRNLGFFSAALVLVQIVYGGLVHLELRAMIALALSALLAAIPVALPATFTLAAALGARSLARRGVLPTRLAAVDEAGSMDLLCSDKTGTLTENALSLTAVRPAPGEDENRVMAHALLASAEAGMDPVDAAVRKAAAAFPAGMPATQRIRFVPFDPAEKLSRAWVRDSTGTVIEVVKGAFERIASLAPVPASLALEARELERTGQRVLGVASGAPNRLAWSGLIALSDPPRADAPAMIEELRSLGIRTVMVTGDAASTAAAVAQAVGIKGRVCSAGEAQGAVQVQGAAQAQGATPTGECAVYAGVLPEDKFNIVRDLQRRGHVIGMCGDGANDAPALRQAQMGIAVASATDAAKSAAGIVLTQPGLEGIVKAVHCGRVIYQRILTYTLRSLTAKINQMLFLTFGLLLTGEAVLTPMLVAIVVISGDFLAMSATTDRVRESSTPNAWHVDRIMRATVVLGGLSAAFCTTMLLIARLHFGLLPHRGLRSLAAVLLVFSTQADFYVVRERRRLWSSRPGGWVILCSLLDMTIVTGLATEGILMHPLPWPPILAVLGACALFALLLDEVKARLFRRLDIE